MTAALMAVITPVVNACSAVIFETYRGEKPTCAGCCEKFW